jgi:hypothetical protein
VVEGETWPFTVVKCVFENVNCYEKELLFCEISSSHGGEYDVQSCLLGCTAV